jgi:glycosyltransferase involved in cell wall biosynthesis
MAAYVSLLAEAGYPVTVFSVAKGADGESVRLDARVRHVKEPGTRWVGFRRSSALWQQAQAARIDLVHSHGLWTDVNRLAADIARRRSLPHLLAPCGMLAPGALRRHWWKKVPVRFWFQDRALRETRCLHAKSHKEYEDIRRFGLRNPVAIIPNAILSPLSSLPSPLFDFRRSHQIADNRRIVLFLGRLHPVKGLPRLLQAWARVQKSVVSGQWSRGPSSCNWHLVLAGPDEGGHRRELESLVAELGCQNSVRFTGELNDKQKWGALAAADLFVMPSDFENFGNAIVEAMSCAIPVITTTGTPWEELRGAGAGWWVAPAIEELTGALREALAMSDEERRTMGDRAFQLAERFRPGRVGEDLIAVYQWLLGSGAKPGCVLLKS